MAGLLIAGASPAQTVVNGSATGPVGNSQLVNLPGWIACSQPSNNSPDVCDMSMPSWNGGTTVTPSPSPDGGSWIGLANGVNPVEQECATGQMTGLVAGNGYQLRFYGACFGTGVGMYANGEPADVTVFIGATEEVVTIPMAAQEWNLYTVCFTATAEEMEFTLQTFTGDGYASLDGFTVAPSGEGAGNVTDTIVCIGSQIILDLTEPNGTYLWQNGSTDPTLTVTEGGTYWVQVNGNCGFRTDTIHVEELEGPVLDLGPDTTLCVGSGLLLAPGIPGTYDWGNGFTGPTYFAAMEGPVVLNLQHSCGIAVDTIVITYAQPPVVDLGNDTTTCNGVVFLLDASTPGAVYTWQDGSHNATFPATAGGSYSVVVSVNGCASSASINLEGVDCETVVMMPNVFSPNGDGSNDRFIPVLHKGVLRSALTIYNRWGQVVYEGSNLDIGWNGRKDGDICADGTYYWHLDFQGNDLQDTMTGVVTLLR